MGILGSTWHGIGATGIALLGCCACGSGGQGDPGAADHSGAKPNLILISLDTLRADRLGCYGYDRPTSPCIDALAERGTLFENTVAEAPWTLPAHASMLTGLFPRTHGVTQPSRRLPSEIPTLAQILSNAGYTTIGLTEGGYLARDYGLHQGFQIYSENRPDLATTLDTARDLLAQVRGEAPFLLFLHTFDVHCPYDPPAEHALLLRSDDEQPIETAGSCGADFNAAPLTAGQVRTLSNRYDGGIHSVDALLGTFLGELEADGALDDTFVVITSDHGEEFYEHGRIGHERTVHREALRVPWIVIGPGVIPSRVSALVGLTDVTPTLLDLVGVPGIDTMEGRSLAHCVRGAAVDSDDPRISELEWKTELYSVMTSSHQLIVDGKLGQRTLIRFTGAGEEETVDGGGKLEQEYLSVLEEHLSRSGGQAASRVDDLDPAQQERLKALGYGD